MIGRAASADVERLLTMAPFDRFNSGKNARVTLRGPNKLTFRCCSITSGLLRSSYIAIPALLMRTSRLSTCPTARLICAALVTSRVKGVTRLSDCCSGPTSSRIHSSHASSECFFYECPADATVGTGDQDCFVFDIHIVLR